MKNNSLKSIIVLGSICLITALLLSSVDLITSPLISEAEKQKEQEAFLEVLPNANTLEDVILGDDVPESVLAMKKASDGSGYAFKLRVTNNYSGNPMNLILGVGPDGKILKLSFIEYTDSPGIGSPEGFNELFKGKDNTTSDNDAGATITTNAIKAVLNDAYAVLGKYSTVEQSDEQKLSLLWESLMPAAKSPKGSFNFTKLDSIDGIDETVLGIFAPSNEVGYVCLIKTETKSVAVSLNAFGQSYAVFDLDGNDLANENNDDCDKARKIAESALKSTVAEKENSNSRRIINAFKSAEGDAVANKLTLKPLSPNGISSTVSAVYKVQKDNKEYFAFMANPIGYGGVIKVLYVLDKNGNITLYKTVSQSESENYGAAIGESGYSEKIVGKTIEAVSDSDILVTGATQTSNAVKKAKEDIKAAFSIVKEGF